MTMSMAARQFAIVCVLCVLCVSVCVSVCVRVWVCFWVGGWVGVCMSEHACVIDLPACLHVCVHVHYFNFGSYRVKIPIKGKRNEAHYGVLCLFIWIGSLCLGDENFTMICLIQSIRKTRTLKCNIQQILSDNTES